MSLVIDNSAGLLPIDFSEVCITRSLWRSGESEYSINGAPCRLLDIQELLSDTGVGRQQHTIVSQSQLDAILSARPEDRRGVIEEAAGISKYRRRKEKAERRLEATEGALLRAQDLLKEVRRQLRPLERQAEAARRHAGVSSELAALRRYLHGRELNLLGPSARRAGPGQGRGPPFGGGGPGRPWPSSMPASPPPRPALDAARQSSEATDLAELVSTAEGLRARASGLVALMTERARGIERDRAAAVDSDVVASLEAEAASLNEQLVGTDREAQELLPARGRAGRGPGGPGPPGRGGRVRPGRGRRRSSGRAHVRARCEPSWPPGSGPWSRSAPSWPAPEARADALAGRKARLEEEVDRSEALARQCADRDEMLSAAAAGAARRLAAAEQALAGRAGGPPGRRTPSATAGRRGPRRWPRPWTRPGPGRARRLAGVEGMLGALVELVDVDAGYEAAFEAAAGEALSAVLMSDEEAARRGLAHLAGHNAAGAVIALAASRARAVGQGAGGAGHWRWPRSWEGPGAEDGPRGATGGGAVAERPRPFPARRRHASCSTACWPGPWS